MASLDARKTRAALLKKGFVPHEGPHHFYVYLHNGKIVAKTMLSHNDQDIGDKLISKMHKQCQISKSEFFDLVNCPLNEEGYIEILRKNDKLK